MLAFFWKGVDPRAQLQQRSVLIVVSGSSFFARPSKIALVVSWPAISAVRARNPTGHTQAAAPAYLGARWTTACTTRIEQAQDGSLRYFGADGRAHELVRLLGPWEDQPGQTGQTLHDPIKDHTPGRGCE